MQCAPHANPSAAPHPAADVGTSCSPDRSAKGSTAMAHAALLAFALFSFQATPPLKIPEAEPVEVALITDDEEDSLPVETSRLSDGDEEA